MRISVLSGHYIPLGWCQNHETEDFVPVHSQQPDEINTKQSKPDEVFAIQIAICL